MQIRHTLQLGSHGTNKCPNQARQMYRYLSAMIDYLETKKVKGLKKPSGGQQITMRRIAEHREVLIYLDELATLEGIKAKKLKEEKEQIDQNEEDQDKLLQSFGV